MIKFEIKSFENEAFGEKVKAVRARELYKGLELDPTHYARWEKKVLSEYVENEDYVLLAMDGEYKKAHGMGNKATTDLILSINTAKHEALKSGSKRGKEVRQYFIDVEKEYRVEVMKSKMPTHLETAKCLVESLEKLEIAEERIDHLEARVSSQRGTIKAITHSSENYSMGEVASLLDLGRNSLMAALRYKKHILTDGRPSSEMTKRELMTCKFNVTYLTPTIRVTPRGLIWLQRNKDGIETLINTKLKS